MDNLIKFIYFIIMAALASVRGFAGRLQALSPVCNQYRMLNLHEYQSKWLMQQHQVRVQKFRVADSPELAQKYAEELGMDALFFAHPCSRRSRNCFEGSNSRGWAWQGCVQLWIEERCASHKKV